MFTNGTLSDLIENNRTVTKHLSLTDVTPIRDFKSRIAMMSEHDAAAVMFALVKLDKAVKQIRDTEIGVR